MYKVFQNMEQPSKEDGRSQQRNQFLLRNVSCDVFFFRPFVR